jgi:5-oxoprolinase (ATP-hydrolysing)
LSFFDGARYRVGPESAGANPGPACYRKGGPLTVTDCNVMLGKIQPDFFPKVFGLNGDLPIAPEVVSQKFVQLAAEIGGERTAQQVAEGFFGDRCGKDGKCCQKNLASARLRCFGVYIVLFRRCGRPTRLCDRRCFGDETGIYSPLCGVCCPLTVWVWLMCGLFAKGAIEQQLNADLLPDLHYILTALEAEGKRELNRRGAESAENELEVLVVRKLRLKYQGSDSVLAVDFADNIEVDAG